MTLTRRRSRVAWRRPFAFNIFGGQYASAGRYVYDHLTWQKRNGPRLEIVWRDEQRYLAADGWKDQFIWRPPAVTLRQSH